MKKRILSLLLVLVMLLGLLPTVYAVTADEVGLTVTGGEILDTILLADDSEIVYVVNVTSESGDFSVTITGTKYKFFTNELDQPVFLADLADPDADAPADYVRTGLTLGEKTLGISMKDAPNPSSATVDNYTGLYNKDVFPEKWYGKHMTGAVTREQLAAILFRYAKQKGYDVSKSVELNGFSDAVQVSGYATDAMRWAVANGLIQGSSNKLSPKATASRAQVATILMRFMELYAK